MNSPSIATLLALTTLGGALFAQPAPGNRPAPDAAQMPAPPPPPGDPMHAPHMWRLDGGPREMESVTFLGIATSTVSPALVAQLGLPEDTGVVVVDVMPDAPAASVLKKYDILLRLDDQILIDPRQLAVLVRSHKAGDEVTFTYVRGGKQATARVKLAKHDVPKMSLNPPRGMFMPGPLEDSGRVLSLLEQAKRPGGPMTIRPHPGAPRMRAFGINTTGATLIYRDDQGTLELTTTDGEKNLVAKDPTGKQVFSGPVATDEQRKALPPDLRDRLEKLESMQGVGFRPDGDFKAETKVPHQQIELRRFRAAPDLPPTQTM